MSWGTVGKYANTFRKNVLMKPSAMYSKNTLIKKIVQGAGERVQLGRCLPYKSQNLSSTLRTQIITIVIIIVVIIINSQA